MCVCVLGIKIGELVLPRGQGFQEEETDHV